VRKCASPPIGDLHLSCAEPGRFSTCAKTRFTAAVFRRKAIYELLHPETRHDAFKGNQHTGSRQNGDKQVDRFTSATARATGKSTGPKGPVEKRVGKDAMTAAAIAELFALAALVTVLAVLVLA
jgi:hypothetical protein